MEGSRLADLGAFDVRQGSAVFVRIGVGDGGSGVFLEAGMLGFDSVLLLVHFVVDAARFKTPGAAAGRGFVFEDDGFGESAGFDRIEAAGLLAGLGFGAAP